MTTLITFDVDGTLIKSAGANANALHKEAFAAAFREVYNIDTNIDVVQHHGGTDPLIIYKVLAEKHSMPVADIEAKLEAARQHMVDHYLAQKQRAGDGLQLLPGIKELLQALQQHTDVKVGLVTGNLEPIGWAKMEALGIKDLFSQPNFGGFGTDVCSGNWQESWRDRAKLINVAEHKAGIGIHKRTFHVGDTPFDVMAAKEAGVVPVGVTTGVFSADDLMQAVPETVLVPNFRDLDTALTIFGLS